MNILSIIVFIIIILLYYMKLDWIFPFQSSHLSILRKNRIWIVYFFTHVIYSIKKINNLYRIHHQVWFASLVLWSLLPWFFHHNSDLWSSNVCMYVNIYEFQTISLECISNCAFFSFFSSGSDSILWTNYIFITKMSKEIFLCINEWRSLHKTRWNTIQSKWFFI